MALVFESFALPRRAERLAGAGAGPDGPIVGPPGESECVAPAANSGEEVALRVSAQVVRSDIGNAPFVNVAGRDVAGSNQVPQPLRRVGINFVVIGAHGHAPFSPFTKACISAASRARPSRCSANCAKSTSQGDFCPPAR